jgi:hypothetical protein
VEALDVLHGGRRRGFHEADGVASHRRSPLFERFEVRAAISPGASLPVAGQDVEDVKLDGTEHDLLARDQADDRLERDAVNVKLAICARAGGQDARELISDVRQAV